jgi:serine/threonine protein kinase
VPYLVMEHVTGPGLGQLLREHGPMSPLASVDVVSQILSALEESHAAGVLHDDVKCDNVLVETQRDGTQLPRLIDFGLARFTDAPPVADDRERMVSGTPEYLAPELIRGELPTPMSDVYAVGIVLYELVTGATPFAGGSHLEVMQRQMCDEAVPMIVRRRDGQIPLALERAVRRALAKNSADRFSSARAFRTALAEAMSTAPGEPAVTADAVVRGVDEAPTARTLLPTSPASRVHSVARKHRAISEAIDRGDPDEIVLAYLELARALVDTHALEDAILELKAGVALLTAPSGKLLCRSVWRLQLTLAALYDGNGERTLARRTTAEARARASVAESQDGRERANALFRRLGSRQR